MKLKRKLLIFLTTFVIFVSLTGCNFSEVNTESNGSKPSMFVEIEQTSVWRIVYHKETKVMYAVSDGSHNRGTFTVLLDEYGYPMLYEEDEL